MGTVMMRRISADGVEQGVKGTVGRRDMVDAWIGVRAGRASVVASVWYQRKAGCSCSPKPQSGMTLTDESKSLGPNHTQIVSLGTTRGCCENV